MRYKIKKDNSFGNKHGFRILFNFKIVDENDSLFKLIKNINGIEFCFLETEYRIYVSWNELFNDKVMKNKISQIINSFLEE